MAAGRSERAAPAWRTDEAVRSLGVLLEAQDFALHRVDDAEPVRARHDLAVFLDHQRAIDRLAVAATEHRVRRDIGIHALERLAEKERREILGRLARPVDVARRR